MIIFFLNLQVQILSWFDNPNDRVLLDLIPYFEKLASHPNVVDFLKTNSPPTRYAAIGTKGLSLGLISSAMLYTNLNNEGNIDFTNLTNDNDNVINNLKSSNINSPLINLSSNDFNQRDLIIASVSQSNTLISNLNQISPSFPSSSFKDVVRVGEMNSKISRSSKLLLNPTMTNVQSMHNNNNNNNRSCMVGQSNLNMFSLHGVSNIQLSNKLMITTSSQFQQARPSCLMSNSANSNLQIMKKPISASSMSSLHHTCYNFVSKKFMNDQRLNWNMPFTIPRTKYVGQSDIRNGYYPTIGNKHVVDKLNDD